MNKQTIRQYLSPLKNCDEVPMGAKDYKYTQRELAEYFGTKVSTVLPTRQYATVKGKSRGDDGARKWGLLGADRLDRKYIVDKLENSDIMVYEGAGGMIKTVFDNNKSYRVFIEEILKVSAQ